MKYIKVSDAIETAWMILKGLGYRYEENSQLAKDVRDVFETAPSTDLRSIIDAIKSIPAADVRPVRHGCWIADKEDVEWGNSLIRYRCSECKERPHFDKDKYKFILSPYCHNCGADMREPPKEET